MSAPGPERDAGAEEARHSFLRDDLPTLALAVVVALFVRTFLLQTFYVPSGSMLPTLLIGDHVFVNKFVYGPRIPGMNWRFPGLRAPRRGEVIVFQFARGPRGIYPVDRAPDLPADNFVKRLVGMPGDRVAYRGERLILNGAPVPWEPTGLQYTDAGGRRLNVYIETLGDCRHAVFDDPRIRRRDMREITIEPGRYLFIGDNRDHSHDGRIVGTVRLVDLHGPTGLNYWSWDWTGGWLELLNPLLWIENLRHKMRWGRMGRSVDCLAPGEMPKL